MRHTISIIVLVGVLVATASAATDPNSPDVRVYLPIVSSSCAAARPTRTHYVDWEDGYERFRTIFINADLTDGRANLRLTTRRGDEPDYQVENITAHGPCTTTTTADLAAFSLDVLNRCIIAADHPYPEWFVDFLIDIRESGRPCPPPALWPGDDPPGEGRLRDGPLQPPLAVRTPGRGHLRQRRAGVPGLRPGGHRPTRRQYVDLFLRLQREARLAGRGLWSQ